MPSISQPNRISKGPSISSFAGPYCISLIPKFKKYKNKNKKLKASTKSSASSLMSINTNSSNITTGFPITYKKSKDTKNWLPNSRIRCKK